MPSDVFATPYRKRADGGLRLFLREWHYSCDRAASVVAGGCGVRTWSGAGPLAAAGGVAFCRVDVGTALAGGFTEESRADGMGLARLAANETIQIYA
jgi:hypothetical protein